MTLIKSSSSEGTQEVAQSEYGMEWRDLIFLPFHETWNFFLHLTIVLNASLCLFDVSFTRDSSHAHIVDLLHYALGVPFLMDVILSIMHRNMEHRITRNFECKNIFLLAIDVLTLIPIYEIYLFLTSISRHTTGTFVVRNGCRTIAVIRLYRVFMYLHHLAGLVGHNQALIITLAEFLKIFLVTYLGAIAWFSLSCWRCTVDNWTNNLEFVLFNPTKSEDWFIICYVVIGRLFLYSYRGFIRGETIPERLVMMGSMVAGFIIHGMLYLSALTEAVQKFLLRQYLFERQLSFIISILNDWRVPKEIKDKTLEYYEALWVKRTGIYYMPLLFHNLPDTMQKEVTIDIYWEALRHSQLFRDMPIPFKRSLSLHIKSEMYLPGDYVYQLNEMKSEMVYIVSGVVQILTGEDEESPIISFSNGTILGEASVVRPTKSNAHVRAASFCEVQTLSYRSLFHTLLSYPDLSESILELMDYRVATAIYLRHLKEEKLEKTKTNSGVTFIDNEAEESTIKWLKARWRLLTKLQAAKRLKDETVLTRHVQHEHTSRNLDLLVLSADFELKTKAICLTHKCPFILEPSSSFRKFCYYVVIFACLLQATILPYAILILDEIPAASFTILLISDLFYMVDIYLQISTAVKDENQFLTRPIPILQYKLKHMPFVVDVVATIPLDLIARFLGVNERYGMLLRLNRVLKVYRVLQLVIRREKHLLINYALIRVVKYMLIFSFAAYWITCVLYGIDCDTVTCQPYSVLRYNGEVAGKAFTLKRAVARILHYVLSVFFHMNTSNNYETQISDLVSAYLICMFGNFLCIFFTAEMAASFFVRYRERENYKIYIHSINQYMIKNHIDDVLREQVNELLQFRWYRSENRTIVGDTGVLTHAPTYLKKLIVYRRIVTCLRAIPLFMKCEEELLKNVATRMIHRTLPPNALLVAADNRSRWLHCIVRGYCTQHSVMPGDKERGAVTILKAGDSFPVVEVLHQVLVLVNVRTLTTVEMASISYNDLQDIFHANQSFGKGVLATLEGHMMTYGKSLRRTGGRLPDITAAERSKGQGELFRYELMDEDEINYTSLAFNKPFIQYGRWRFIRYLFFHQSINPRGHYFLYWEISRFVIAIFRTFIAITYGNFLVRHDMKLEPILYFCTATSVVDMYVRMHCQYYNQRGILVTHPLYTAQHYFKTSFALDVWCVLPIFLFADLFGATHKQQVAKILKIISRPLSLYRFISYLNYRQMNIQSSRTSSLQVLKYFIVTLTFLGAMASFLQMCTCKIWRNDDGGIDVTGCNNTWITMTVFKNFLQPEELFLECFYVIVTLFTNTATGVFKSTIGHLIQIIVLYVILFIPRLFLFTRLVGSRIRRNVNLTIFQEKVESFEIFMKKELVDEDLIEATIDHYKFRWKRSHGNDIAKDFSEFHPQLHEDLIFDLFDTTLKAACFFEGADNSFFRRIGVHMKEEYFKKDVEIIRCNDVQNLIYFVHKGTVDILVAKSKVCTLGKGGAFGCLSKTGKIRQTISVNAKVHVSVLTIDSIVFHKIVATYSRVAIQVQHANFVNAEFIESKHFLVVQEDQLSRDDLASRSTFASAFNASRISRMHSKMTIMKVFELRLNSEGKKYKIYYYLMSCHLAPITSILYLLLIFNVRFYDKYAIYGHIFTSILDLIFLTRIFVGFHLTYIDADTGNVIKEHRLITKRYTHNVRKFCLDVCTCLPVEYLLMIIYNGIHFNCQWGWINRIFRFDFFIQYYYEKQEKLEVNTNLRITYLTYWFLFVIQATASMWMFTACTDDGCHYNRKGSLRPSKVMRTTNNIEELSIVFNFAITTFTTTNLRVVQPMDIEQIVLCTVLSFLFFGITIELVSGFITMYSISHYTMRRYEYDIDNLKIYLKGRKLSPFIFNKVLDYCLHLWRKQRGEWTPALIATAPSYLQQDLMYALYGHYVESHVLFARTHIHFIRQLVMHLKRTVFFPGNYLAEAGDIDGCMFFIHNGMVDVIDKSGMNDTHMERLKKGNTFGEAQGLLGIPHKFHYCAYSVVDAVLLKYSDWKHLLHWFPASKQQLYQGAAELGLYLKKEED